ncbi:GDP-L-fucose synthase [Forsythia ovata]|uniref:GDP-L-fucose synthase n=1 Tax=Forsythia ovata TaxID=205694 RepID=A0ABD1XDL7_9LAMI
MDPISVEKSTPVFVAGHGGLVGSALVTKLQSLGYTNLLLRAHIPSSISPFRHPQAYICHPLRPQGWRHPRQQHLPWRLHYHQHPNPNQCNHLYLKTQHKEASLSRLFLYLPEICPTTHLEKFPFNSSIRAHVLQGDE